MNSLLKRQIRKFLSEELASSKGMEQFLDAIGRSYTNFDNQFTMQQRAMALSSDELFNANQQLIQESKAQQEVIDKLMHVIETLRLQDVLENKNSDFKDLDGSKLIDFIDDQAKQIVEINKQQEHLLGELAHQNKELSEYAHMVSHDLKSPLRTIDTLTYWLKKDYTDAFDEMGTKSLDLIRSNVEKMDLLISGILEYSTIGKNQVELYNVDLNEIISDVLKLVEVPDHINIIKKDSLPIVKGDKYRLQQLFQNLITNGIKYNDKPEGVVEVGYKDIGEFWEFYVKDNGKGIDATYYDKIFETFQKLENNTESTGIGLSIVKKIIEVYQGKIWVESEVGTGTTFCFTIKK